MSIYRDFTVETHGFADADGVCACRPRVRAQRRTLLVMSSEETRVAEELLRGSLPHMAGRQRHRQDTRALVL
jgi:hypothetical protein